MSRPQHASETADVTPVVRDISARRAAEAGLRRLAAIIESLRDAIIVAGADGVITDWNPAAERLHGWSAQDMVGEHIHTLIPPGHEKRLRRAIDRALGGKVVDGLEAAHRCADGSCVSVELTISPIRDGDGGLLGVSTIAHDISERVRARDELAAHTERLQRLERDARHATTDPAPVKAPTGLQSIVERVLGVVREQLGMDVAWLAEFADGQMVFRALEGERDSSASAWAGGRPGGHVLPARRRRADRLDRPRHPRPRPRARPGGHARGRYRLLHRCADPPGRWRGLWRMCAASHEPDPTLAERDPMLPARARGAAVQAALRPSASRPRIVARRPS